MMMKVYTPEDVMNKRNEMIPDFVITAFNDLLTENYADEGTVIKQDDAISRILQYSKDDELTREIIFKKRWLDIEPKQEDVRYNDSIQTFPIGYDIVITNPPYLAKTSASRLKLPYPDTHYDDVYKLCMYLMLENCRYVAAIIPESFITSDLFHDRLYGVISLNIKMFSDTDCPVCLALFIPQKENNDFVFYVGDNKVGNYNELKKYDLSEFSKGGVQWKFNDPYGIIGVKCVDNQVSNDIYFHYGDKIKPEDIKVSSRAFTRISGLPDNIDLDDFIDKCNEILNEYRNRTHDIFLTSFKGLRKDGVYRRRIDFKTVKCIMNKAIKLY